VVPFHVLWACTEAGASTTSTVAQAATRAIGAPKRLLAPMPKPPTNTKTRFEALEPLLSKSGIEAIGLK